MSDATWYLVGISSIIFLVMFVVVNIIIVYTPVMHAPSYALESRQISTTTNHHSNGNAVVVRITTERSKLELNEDGVDSVEEDQLEMEELPTSTTTTQTISTAITIDEDVLNSTNNNNNGRISANNLKIEELKKHK